MDWIAWTLAIFRASVFTGIVPLAGLRSQPAQVKAMLSACLSVVLLPGTSAALVTESALHLGLQYIGQAVLMAAFVTAVNELYAAVTSIWSVQVGLSYSSVLDPTKESESTSLTSLIQLLFLMHFTALDLHLGLIVHGFSEEASFMPTSSAALFALLATIGKSFISHGLMWGLPYLALLLSVDLVLAIGSKLYERFQGSQLGNPLKILLLLLLLLLTLPLWRSETGTSIASLLNRQ